MKLKRPILKLIARFRRMKESPHAVSLGVGIGIFFGFSPLLGFKTLLAFALAWVLRASKTAAVIAVSLHDLFLPLFPVFLRWEYDIGYFVLSEPHELPPHMAFHHVNLEEWLHWSTFFTLGRPLLVGSLILGGAVASIAYVLARISLDGRARKSARSTDP